MRKSTAAAATTLFFLVGPVTTVGLVPWWLTGWRVAHPLSYGAPVQVAGAILIIVGVGVLAHTFGRFATEGVGTPVPLAPPAHLVVGGLYRHVRNPMYLALLLVVIGQAIVLGQVSLAVYAAAMGLGFVTFVRVYEEPTLTQKFGTEYESYRRAVPGWWPRLHPWRP